MKHIKVNTDNGYQELKPEEGYFITSYNEKDGDILKYFPAIEVDVKLGEDISIYRTITPEQDKIYQKKKEEALKIMEAEFEAKALDQHGPEE